MIYNLLFDTRFNNGETHWKYKNCYYENGKFISTDKVFGIYQEITLANLTTIYARCMYTLLTEGINKVVIGIQNADELSIIKGRSIMNRPQRISIVETNREETIKLHIIFESTKTYNEVIVREPLLCDLNKFSKSTFLKAILDKTIKYRDGCTYTNILGYNELTSEFLNLDNAKIGCIFDSLQSLDIKIDAKLDKGKFYLVKLNYININNLGQVYFTYGVMKSKFTENQTYMLFKGSDQDLVLHVVPNNVLPYKVNLKYILLAEINTQNFDMVDIPYLPYIK